MCQQKYLDTTKLCLKWPSSRATLYKHWTLSRLSMNLKWPWAKYKGQTCVSSVAHTHTHTKRRKRFSVLHPVSVRRSRTNQSCCSARSLSIWQDLFRSTSKPRAGASIFRQTGKISLPRSKSYIYICHAPSYRQACLPTLDLFSVWPTHKRALWHCLTDGIKGHGRCRKGKRDPLSIPAVGISQSASKYSRVGCAAKHRPLSFRGAWSWVQ